MGFLTFFRGNITDVWKIRNTATLFPAYTSLSPPTGLLLSHQLYLWCNSKQTDVANVISLIYTQTMICSISNNNSSCLTSINFVKDFRFDQHYWSTSIHLLHFVTKHKIYHLYLLIMSYVLLFASNNRRTSTVLVNYGLHVSIFFNILSELLRALSLVDG